MNTRKIKLIAYAGILALLSSMIVGLLGYSTSTQQIRNIKDTLLTTHLTNNVRLSKKYVVNYYGTLTAGEGTLLDSEGRSIEGSTEAVDSVLEDLGNKSTIFVKEGNDFRRIATNIMHDETRALGTYLGTDHNAYASVINGDIYVGEAEVLGDDFYSAYDPITDLNGNVIGMLFVGVPTAELNSIINAHETDISHINLLIIILRAVSFGALIALVALSLTGEEKDRPGKESDKPGIESDRPGEVEATPPEQLSDGI